MSVDDGAGRVFASYPIIFKPYSASDTIAGATAVNTAASYYSGGLSGFDFQVGGVDVHHVEAAALSASWSAQNSAYAASVAAAVRAVPALSNINVIVTGFGA